MRLAFLVSVCVIVLLTQARAADADRVNPQRLEGCWRETVTAKKRPTTLTLDKRSGRFGWQNNSGRFKTWRGQIWLLNKNGKDGEKWRYQLNRSATRLTFTNPEGFRYMGRGRYVYFRFRSKHTRRAFRRTRCRR